MNPLQLIIRSLGGQARRPGRLAIYITMASTAIKVIRRVTNTQQRTLLQFEVKPGEIFEIRGVRRGR